MSAAGRRLAGVFAHPDDESRIVGGTLALAAACGVEVAVYCATRGEAGDPRRSAEETAALREGELRAACEVLGIGDVWLDDFPDGALAEVEPEAVVGRIVRFLRTVRPQTVITFGSDGRTGHADHVAVGRLAEAAFAAAADAGQQREQLGEGLQAWQAGWLYHTVVAASVARRFGWTGPSVADEELMAVDVTGVLARKQQAAMRCHASQWELSPMRLADGEGWEPWSVEHFRLARAAATVESDPVVELAETGPVEP